MKDLITVFAYCPDNHRKKILQNLLTQLQVVRDDFDIMVVSHSQISELSYDMVDYFHYDKTNKLLTDFDVRKKHWYVNHLFDVNTTLTYPPSTHLAIYSLLYYTFNFSKFKGYRKIHGIEYDINLVDTNLFYDVSKNLNSFNSVMFQKEDTWVYGTYFATTIEDLSDDFFKYDEELILNELRMSETKMSERITQELLTKNGRTILYEPLSKLDPTGKFQKFDSHENDSLMWCVPLCEMNSNMVHFFVYNEKGGEYDVNVIVNGHNTNIKIKDIGMWHLIPLGDINEITDILILVNNKIKTNITLNDENRGMFRDHNFFKNL